MADRVMFVHLKTGHSGDSGPSWISLVRFNKTWKTAYWHGRTLARWQGFDANLVDLETDEEYWVSGPKRDRTDARYSHVQPEVDEDVRGIYEAFLNGARLPGREDG
jgi:hypothetical protein